MPIACHYNPKTVGGMCYAILDLIGLIIPSQYKIINNHQSQPSLQQVPLGKDQSETAITGQESQTPYPNMQVWNQTSYPSMQCADKLSQHA